MPRGSPDWGFLAPQKSLMQLLREQNHFYRNISTAAGGAGKYTRHQFWNPSGSLVDAYIVAFGHKAGAAGEIRTGWATGYLSGLEGYGRNRYSGGTPSDIEARWEWKNTAFYSEEMYRGEIGTTFVWVEAVYLWLKPGYGLDFILMTANVAMETCLMWYEFPSTEV
jgi:hypothetical protein